MKRSLASGVYKITNMINNKCYVGSSINVNNRIKNHKDALKNRNHRNQYLQNSWNKYGESKFKFEIIKRCRKKLLLIHEQECIDKFKSVIPNGYNICPMAGNTLGLIVTEDTKKKIANSVKGYKHTEKAKRIP